MVSAAILSWLRQAGLEKYTNNFGAINEHDFLNLAMHEYGKFGITAAEDKQKLFRLLKAVNKEVDSSASNGMAPGNQNLGWQGNAMDPGAGLLDLDENDGDLLSHAGFQVSPLGRQGEEGLPFSSPDPPKIRVVVRKRPISKKEREKGDEDIVEVNVDKAYVIVNETKVKVDLTKYLEKHQFNFDDAHDESVSNETVYKSTVGPLVHTLFKNGKATCFAYGQTGSGKTYTMGPLPVRAAGDILSYLSYPQFSDVQLYVSCFEIYGNKAFDLLNQRKKLNILEDGKKKVVVVGLKEYTVESVDYLKRLIDESATKRSTGTTAANSDSSRSHSIMQFVLKRPTPDGEGKQVGKISFIDLAGSERGADTFDNDRQTRLEGAEINKSLLALKECIRALDADARHVPFRGSKLTAVLRDSFLGAQARTVMIACIGPNSSSVEHTLNTLRYADRVKELRKDKAERDPGGVTPGQNPNYYASVSRAEEAPPPPAAAVVKSSPRRELSPTRLPNGFAPGPSVNAGGRGNGSAGYSYGYMQDDELISARDELMNTILEEEEELITAHRMQIEETMEIVRKEMSLLTEVDQPGSAIDQYVEKLEAILQLKAQGIAELRQKLDSFKQKLREEEIMSRTMGAKRYGQ